MRKDTEILLRQWWIDQLKNLTEKVMDAEAKRQERLKKKSEKLLGQYEGWTYNDVHEAYGVGSITEREYDRLTDLLEKREAKPDELYYMKLELLSELYREQRDILRKYEQFKQIHDGGEQE